MRPRQLDRLKAPDDPPRLGRQRVEHAPASRHETLGADVHPAAVDDGRDCDELLGRPDESPRPQSFAARRIDRERCRVGGPVEPRPGDREAVRTVVRRLDRVLPEQRAAANVDRVDTRVGILEVHHVSSDDRVGGDRTEARAVRTQGEAPAHLELRDRPRVEVGRRGRPLARRAPVGRGPRHARGTIAAAPAGEAPPRARPRKSSAGAARAKGYPGQEAKRRGRDSPGAQTLAMRSKLARAGGTRDSRLRHPCRLHRSRRRLRHSRPSCLAACLAGTRWLWSSRSESSWWSSHPWTWSAWVRA